MNKWLSLTILGLSLSSANAFAKVSGESPTGLPVVEAQPMSDPSIPRQEKLPNADDDAQKVMLMHGELMLDKATENLAVVAGGNYTYLENYSTDVDGAENYYAQVDPGTHAQLSAGLTFTLANKIRVTGYSSLSAIQSDFKPGMQIRLSYVDGSGKSVSEYRTMSKLPTLEGGQYFIHFDYGFSDTFKDNYTDWRRVGHKYNLDLWKTANSMTESNSTITAYSNDADLGFGRRMMAKRNGDEAAFSVGNYTTANNANNGGTPLATVTMEYSRIDGQGSRQTQFYVFDDTGRRIINIDLDGNGVKQIPHLCYNCHDTNFIPFDLDSLGYPDANSRDDQQSEFKILNEIVRDTNTTARATELIGLWYANSNTQQSEVIPTEWAKDPAVYNNVLKPYCRSCHLTLNNPGPMDNANFMDYQEGYISLFCNEGYTMPHAKVTHEALMNDNLALSTLTNRFKTPIECWEGTPTLSDFSHSGTIDMTYAGIQVTTRQIKSDVPVERIELQLVRKSDSQCLNFDNGQVIAHQNNEACWGEESFGHVSFLPSYTYVNSWHYNASTHFKTWLAGEYEVHARAWGVEGQLSKTTSGSFVITRPTPTVSNFTISEPTFNKADDSNVSYTYNLDANQSFTKFERAIKRNSDGAWISLPSSGTTSYSNRWSTWSVLNLNTSSSSNKYSYNGVINAHLSYADWQDGTYTLYTRAQNADGVWSADTKLYFYIVNQPMPPSINGWSVNPSTWYKTSNSNVNFSYSLTTDQTLVRFERKIVKNGRCINPANGQSGSCWHDYTALNQTGSNSSNVYYGVSGSLNPSTAYAGWDLGSYYIYVRGYNAAGQMSNQRYLYFRLR